jgi:hypothetical protein
MTFFKVSRGKTRRDRNRVSPGSWNSKYRTKDRRETITTGYVKGTVRTWLLRRALELNFKGKRPMTRRRHWKTGRRGETCQDIEKKYRGKREETGDS